MKKILALLILLSYLVCNAQIQKETYSDVSIKDLEMKVYPQDSSANAVVLSDIGNIYYYFDFGIRNFKIGIERHVRIKILSKDGLSHAESKIYYIKKQNVSDEIGVLKGCTYNLENGKIIKTQLSNQSIFDEQVTKDISAKKFSLPNVKVGSVIEYKYTIISGFTGYIPTWYFQREIPVKKAKLDVSIPEKYKFKVLMRGYESYKVSKQYKDTEKVGIFYNNNYSWEAEHMPAFKKEAYIACVKDYLNSVEFELSRSNPYQSSWESMCKILNESKYFGDQLYGGSYLQKAVKSIKNESKNELDLLTKAYTYIKNSIKWNNKYGKYTTSTLRKAFKEKSGNVADINLMLIVLLRKLGFEAYPVILSTKDNGILHPAQITLSKYNYVIARVKVGEEQKLLDATDYYCPIGLLPSRCVNGKGRVIKGKYSGDISIDSYNAYSKTIVFKAKLKTKGEIEGQLKINDLDYAALKYRKLLSNKNKEEEYIEKLENENPNLEILDYSFKNKKDLNKPLIQKFNIKLNLTQKTDDLIYFSPCFFEQIKSNPFKLEERKYPVDFNYKRNHRYYLSFEIPKEYTISECPKSTKFSLPNNGGSFIYSIKNEDNKISIMYNLKINKSIFYVAEYSAIKYFFDLIVQKLAEKVVLNKKINKTS